MGAYKGLSGQALVDAYKANTSLGAILLENPILAVMIVLAMIGIVFLVVLAVRKRRQLKHDYGIGYNDSWQEMQAKIMATEMQKRTHKEAGYGQGKSSHKHS